MELGAGAVPNRLLVYGMNNVVCKQLIEEIT